MLSQWVIKSAKKKYQNIQLMRGEVGRLTSIIGIIVNIILSILKILSGFIFNSVSMLADGINNLSDAGNALILLVSFKLSSKPSDEDHPYGHERIEYLASLVVGVSILLLSIELFKTSISKIIHPETIDVSIMMIGILIISIIGKLCLCIFYKRCAKEIDSTVLYASAQDSISDVLSTLSVLVSVLIYVFFNMNLDGIIGSIAAIIIFINGIKILKEAADKILGEAFSSEYAWNIEKKIMSYPGVCGIHDLMIHNYGPNRCYASLHVEVDSRMDIMESHDLIDEIEQYFRKIENIHMVIHMDPIVLNDPKINKIHGEINRCVYELSKDIQIHDFRSVQGKNHINLIFDCMVPYSCTIPFSSIEQHIQTLLDQSDEKYHLHITFERPFVK